MDKYFTGRGSDKQVCHRCEDLDIVYGKWKKENGLQGRKFGWKFWCLAI